MIGFDIEYKDAKEARLLMWRPNQVTENGRNNLKAKEVCSQVSRSQNNKEEKERQKLIFQCRSFGMWMVHQFPGLYD